LGEVIEATINYLEEGVLRDTCKAKFNLLGEGSELWSEIVVKINLSQAIKELITKIQ
jgi:hypothetical protein